jgi:hypothetical protein
MAHTFPIRKVLTTRLINGVKSCFRVITQELWSGGLDPVAASSVVMFLPPVILDTTTGARR